MCLAVPLKVVELVEEGLVIVEGDGVKLQASSVLTPEIKLDDNCLVHAGFIIQKISEEDAKEKRELFKEFYEKVGERE